MITPDISTWHIIDIYEKLIETTSKIILTEDQYCVILDPVDQNGKNQKGSKKIVKGHTSFFLQPGETLENGLEDIFILSETQALLLVRKAVHLLAKSALKEPLCSREREQLRVLFS